MIIQLAKTERKIQLDGIKLPQFVIDDKFDAIAYAINLTMTNEPIAQQIIKLKKD